MGRKSKKPKEETWAQKRSKDLAHCESVAGAWLSFSLSKSSWISLTSDTQLSEAFQTPCNMSSLESIDEWTTRVQQALCYYVLLEMIMKEDERVQQFQALGRGWIFILLESKALTRYTKMKVWFESSDRVTHDHEMDMQAAELTGATRDKYLLGYNPEAEIVFFIKGLAPARPLVCIQRLRPDYRDLDKWAVKPGAKTKCLDGKLPSDAEREKVVKQHKRRKRQRNKREKEAKEVKAQEREVADKVVDELLRRFGSAEAMHAQEEAQPQRRHVLRPALGGGGGSENDDDDEEEEEEEEEEEAGDPEAAAEMLELAKAVADAKVAAQSFGIKGSSAARDGRGSGEGGSRGKRGLKVAGISHEGEGGGDHCGGENGEKDYDSEDGGGGREAIAAEGAGSGAGSCKRSAGVNRRARESTQHALAAETVGSNRLIRTVTTTAGQTGLLRKIRADGTLVLDLAFAYGDAVAVVQHMKPAADEVATAKGHVNQQQVLVVPPYDLVASVETWGEHEAARRTAREEAELDETQDLFQQLLAEAKAEDQARREVTAS